MQRTLAIAFLTVKAAFRFRLILLLGVLLLTIVILLPLFIKDDGTARGFTQILLTYTLGSITTLLALATLWLACGTLARDVEECQMQMIAVKPVARWQIWLGKWTGIMMLNIALLAVTGGTVLGLLQWRAGRLSPEQQDILRNEVLVARGSAREPVRDWKTIVDQAMQQQAQQTDLSTLDQTLLRKQIAEQVKAAEQLVPAGYYRRWEIPLGSVKDFLKDKPLFLRVKFMAAGQTSSEVENNPRTYLAGWLVGPPETPKVRRQEMRLPAGTYNEFPVPPNLFDEQGLLTIEFHNLNPETLLFPLEDGIEVLYREGGFALNFFRGLGIIACWLAMLAALGLAAASFLSFPVASFVAMAVLIIGLSSSTLSQVVEEGGISGLNHDTGQISNRLWIDKGMVLLFSGMLKVIKLVQDFSPIDLLSSGRSITWLQLGRAILQIVLLMGGFLALIGISLFTRRELATAQGTQ
jgi:hypothetical protein